MRSLATAEIIALVLPALGRAGLGLPGRTDCGNARRPARSSPPMCPLSGGPHSISRPAQRLPDSYRVGHRNTAFPRKTCDGTSPLANRLALAALFIRETQRETHQKTIPVRQPRLFNKNLTIVKHRRRRRRRDERIPYLPTYGAGRDRQRYRCVSGCVSPIRIYLAWSQPMREWHV